MAEGQLSRRTLLEIGVAGSLALLTGCSRPGPRLVARRGDLPERWLRRLPSDWQVRWLEGATKVREAVGDSAERRPALVQLSDGWATDLPLNAWASLDQPALLRRLTAGARPVSRLYGGPEQPPVAFPWSFNPWVLVLRDRPDLAVRASRGWELLLDESLAGRVVLPSSPRVVMALVGNDPERLCRLRRQALAHDDRQGLQLLLSGPARAAVLPRQQVVPLLRRDPRLTVLLPDEGAPASWSLILRPAGSAVAPPAAWLEAVLQPPLLPRVLAAGWVPPLPRAALTTALAGFPPAVARLLLPEEAVLDRCRDLPPLDADQRRRLQELWDGTTPCQQRP
ncbi:MAG: twin-arginine translocation pathway signal [Cyanobacteria bacterium K_Offshore_surface_m2_239]|nr:twin-arginine translocation pathway signal [Cyanobacteria bacterium K_Offshore_surface_m2_239]